MNVKYQTVINFDFWRGFAKEKHLTFIDLMNGRSFKNFGISLKFRPKLISI